MLSSDTSDQLQQRTGEADESRCRLPPGTDLPLEDVERDSIRKRNRVGGIYGCLQTDPQQPRRSELDYTDRLRKTELHIYSYN